MCGGGCVVLGVWCRVCGVGVWCVLCVSVKGMKNKLKFTKIAFDRSVE